MCALIFKYVDVYLNVCTDIWIFEQILLIGNLDSLSLNLSNNQAYWLYVCITHVLSLYIKGVYIYIVSSV